MWSAERLGELSPSYDPPPRSYEPPASRSYEPPAARAYEPPAARAYESPATRSYEASRDPDEPRGYASRSYETPRTHSESRGYETPRGFDSRSYEQPRAEPPQRPYSGPAASYSASRATEDPLAGRYSAPTQPSSRSLPPPRTDSQYDSARPAYPTPLAGRVLSPGRDLEDTAPSLSAVRRETAARQGERPVVRPAPKIDWASLGALRDDEEVTPAPVPESATYMRPSSFSRPTDPRTPAPESAPRVEHTPLSQFRRTPKPSPQPGQPAPVAATPPPAGGGLKAWASGQTSRPALPSGPSATAAAQSNVPAVAPKPGSVGLSGWKGRSALSPASAPRQTPAQQAAPQTRPTPQTRPAPQQTARPAPQPTPRPAAQPAPTEERMVAPVLPKTEPITLGDWALEPQQSQAPTIEVSQWSLPGDRPSSPTPAPAAVPARDETVLLRRLANTERPRRGPRTADAPAPKSAASAAEPSGETWPVLPATGGSGAEPEKEDKKKRKGGGLRIFLIALIGLIVVALIAVGIMWVLSLNKLGGDSSGANPVGSDPLMTEQDLSTGTAEGWNLAAEGTETPALTCMSEPTQYSPDRSESRVFTSANDTSLLAVHALETFADADQAAAEYQARLTQSGTCPGQVAQVTSAYTIANLADEASAVAVLVQQSLSGNEYHTVLLSRTGKVISIVDVKATGRAVTTTKVVDSVLPALSRICAGDQGTCPGPGSPNVAKTVPAAGNPVGWLTTSDLPRITPNAGKWSMLNTEDNASRIGTQCEGSALTSSTASTVQKTTYILTDDPQGPTPDSFGIDEAVFTFADSESAAAMSETLVTNISECQKPGSTATVEQGEAIAGSGVNSVAISGATFVVQQTAQDTVVIRRVAVIVTGNRVAYLMANPTETYDFRDNEWQAIGLRAGERLSQF